MYLELFWSAIFHIWTDHEDLLCKTPHSVQMRENKVQKRKFFTQGQNKKFREH